MRLSRFLVLSVVSLVLLSCASCTRKSAPSGAGGGPLRLQLATEPLSLDPTLAEDGVSLRILCNTMEGLVAYDGAGVLKERLASSHSISKDGTRYVFKLRPGVKWSDGRPLAAADFVTAFRRALSPGSVSRLGVLLFPIRGAKAFHDGHAAVAALGVHAVGDELHIELEKPCSYFLQTLSLPVAFPLRSDVLEKSGGKWPDGPGAPVIGAYRMSSHERDQRIVLERNPLYWDQPGPVSKAEFVIVGDEATALNLFDRGELDVVTRVPSTEVKRLKARGILRIDPFVATYYIAFNVRKPPFNDPVLRRAVAASIRKSELVSALESGETPARSWIPKGIEGYLPFAGPGKVLSITDRARKEAQALAPVTLGFDTGSRNSMVAEKIQRDLAANLGLRVTLMNLDWKSYIRMLQTSPPPIYRLAWLAPFMDPISHLQAFTTGNPNNYTGWSNPEYDRLVREVERLPEGKARLNAILKAQAILTETAAVVVPIYHYVQNTVVSKRVAGFRINPFGVVLFRELRWGK